jgi:uncharacterized protein with von Willebrand factor type A (vWA) domain
MIFARFFYALRGAGLKVGVSEWMMLMRALDAGAIEPDLTDFYAIARSVLVKDEALFDTYDQVFAGVFGANKIPREALEKLLAFVAEAKAMGDLTPEMLARMQELPLDELRKLFEERLKEQDERHDGGNRWIGTAGTSPFGNGGTNPAGMRVGGSGGGRSAIQIASARRFKEYRSDRLLDTRGMAVALKKLRRLSRTEGEPELDVEDSIDKTCKNAGELELVFRPPRKNEARVLLLMDVGGSMDPYSHMVEQLFSAASNLDHWRRFEAFAFHNCVYNKLDPARRDRERKEIETKELLNDRPKETYLIMVGDAYMAPSELIEAYGSIDYGFDNPTAGLVWLHRLRTKFPRAVWLNPIPSKGWYGWTIKLIAQLFPMFPLTLEGLEEAIDRLLKHTTEPPPELPRLPDPRR